MVFRLRTLACCALLLALGGFALPAAVAAERGFHQRLGGLEIYYGILPAQVAGKHAAGHEERTMHGGARTRKDQYHLVVAIDDEQGRRVTDAQVAATVGELGLAGTRRQLDPMPIGTTMSFGNYFPLHGSGPYRITIEVRRPDHPPVIAEFDYPLQPAR